MTAGWPRIVGKPSAQKLITVRSLTTGRRTLSPEYWAFRLLILKPGQGRLSIPLHTPAKCVKDKARVVETAMTR